MHQSAKHCKSSSPHKLHITVRTGYEQSIRSFLSIPVDTLPAVAEIAALLEICDEEVRSTLLHPADGYAALLRQRHAIQRKLESLASYARACCSMADAIPCLMSSRLDTILGHIEQRYFQQHSL